MARKVHLVGIGMGNPATLTFEARDAIAGSDLVIGARRMVEPYVQGAGGRRTLALVNPCDIARALREEDYDAASVIFSGDVGFYSGAGPLAERLSGVADLEVSAIPGISSVAYLCARLMMPWQDVHLVSAHGRECDPVAEVSAHAKTFFLTGGKAKARDICAALAGAGLGDVAVRVGERLSYADEVLVQGTARELAGRDFDDLSVMLVINPAVAAPKPGRLVS